MKKTILSITVSVVLLSASCSHDPEDFDPETTAQIELETYAGGRLGTTFNSSASAYQDPAPAVANAGMLNQFKYGEYFFDRTITQNSAPFNGLGPLYIRSSCVACHPGYGHGRRMERYRADDWGNGYLLVLTDQNDNYITCVTGMPQTKAVAPFKAPINEDGIHISWLPYTDEWGNRFPDGETYSLIYPEVSIDEDAFYVPLDIPYSQLRCRLESTIGLYGVGLLDAIPDDSLKAEYLRQTQAGVSLNPAIWNGSDWAKTYGNTDHPLRFTYALSRGPLQDAPGANAIWNITNVTRSNKKSHYMTKAYATTASQDPEVQAQFYDYFPQYRTEAGVETDIYNYLIGGDLPAEMSDEDYVNFMVWHRGLAVPAARNLKDTTIQRGRKLFREIGCAYCHRSSWKTGDDNFTDPTGFFSDGDARLPRFPYQTIWPYTDMVQHRLFMQNDIRTGWCRTTPLWGRGLSQICTGASDRLHDCRARNVMEAIMWHGSRQSDARRSVENFRQLSKADRDAVIKFINAI